jgi:phospholipase/lecithinase/hemolysin
MRALRPTVIAVLALAMLTPATSWAGLSQIVAFGDSLIDTGNVFAATGNSREIGDFSPISMEIHFNE